MSIATAKTAGNFKSTSTSILTSIQRHSLFFKATKKRIKSTLMLKMKFNFINRIKYRCVINLAISCVSLFPRHVHIRLTFHKSNNKVLRSFEHRQYAAFIHCIFGILSELHLCNYPVCSTLCTTPL